MTTKGVSMQNATHQNAERLPRLADIELVSPGWLNKYVLTYDMPDGSKYRYESISRKSPEHYREELERNARGLPPASDAVCIVPILPDESLLLIKEFRYPLNSYCIAFPAGLIEPGEDLVACVDRELREETGCRVRTDMGADAVYMLPQSGYSSTGLSEENVQIAFAYVERDGDAAPEPTELIEQFTLKLTDIADFLERNTTPIGMRCQLILEIMKHAN